MKVLDAPETATEGRYYLHLAENGPKGGGGGVNVVLFRGASPNFRKGHTFTLSFDMQNGPGGFDTVGIDAISVSSKGAVVGSAAASPPPALEHDGKWHT